jgi:uncharacterized lipoprotein YddW (UPF0748 family)
MKYESPRRMRCWVPVGLALVGLVLVWSGLARRSAAGPTLPPLPPAQQERLWAEVGLNEAWYLVNGHTDAPPPSAPSLFWPTADSRQLITDSPRLVLHPREITFVAHADQPALLSATVSVSNGGEGTLSWVAQLAAGGSFTPTLVPTSGLQGEKFTLTVESHRYSATSGVYTSQVVVTATSGTPLPDPVLDTPQEVLVRLQILGHSTYLPLLAKQVPASPAPEVRAIWVTRYDWTSAYGPEGPADIDNIVANVAGAGFNTIFFQVRAHGDAYYTPGLEPWSARLNADGALGQDPGWDPLARMVEQAHARGLQVHAYVNVYPAWLGTAAPSQGTTPEHPFWSWSYAYGWADWRHWHQSSGVMPLNGGYLWASPGVDGVRDHVVAVVEDIVSRYAVDGVHLDLVRYAGSRYSYDPISNAAAGSIQAPARDQWQRERVTELVGRVRTAIRGIRSDTRLSAAVWYCYDADGCGYGLSSGYADYYQDALGWLSSGRVDAIAPMLYGWSGFEDLDVWRDVMGQFQSASAGRHVYPGISGDFDDFGQIAARVQAARDAGTAGHAIFSYAVIDARGYWDDLAAGPYAHPATLGVMPDEQVGRDAYGGDAGAGAGLTLMVTVTGSLACPLLS